LSACITQLNPDETLAKTPPRVVPIVLAATTMTREIPAAIKAYSMDVAPQFPLRRTPTRLCKALITHSSCPKASTTTATPVGMSGFGF